MDENNYKQELLSILRKHSEQAIRTLKEMDKVLPDKAKEVHIGIHPNQEPDGLFTIMVHLDGPDLYVLNKAIGDYRKLFDVKFVDGQLEPKVPLFDPFDEGFSVNDAIVDTSFVWVEEIWNVFGGTANKLPTLIFGADDYGTSTLKRL